MIYWSRYPQPKEQSQDFLNFSYKHASSAEVEMTSYALLALTIGSQSIAAGFIVPIVMWLTRQRNAQGGFSSTQVLFKNMCKLLLKFFLGRSEKVKNGFNLQHKILLRDFFYISPHLLSVSKLKKSAV